MIKMNRNNGFTLIEVLIATVILAIGLLGLAALQVNSLKNNQSAYMRTQATQMAYDMADRMRSNMVEASTLGLSVYSTVFPENAAPPPAGCTPVAVCSPTSMAQVDLSEWNGYLGILPSGVGRILVAGNMFTITITWDDDKDGIAANNPTFSMSFQL